jgi:predicted nucleotidyltransferase
MRPVFVDTSAWAALADSRDAHHDLTLLFRQEIATAPSWLSRTTGDHMAENGLTRTEEAKAETPPEQEHCLGVSCITPEVIDALKQRIVAGIDPQQIIMFGSQARGDATAGSDIDLLVVQDTSQSDREVRRRIERLLLDRRFGLDLIVRTPEEVALNLADGNPFYTEHIFGDGVVLYDRTAQKTG